MDQLGVKELVLSWPTTGMDKLGHSRIIFHQIHTNYEGLPSEEVDAEVNEMMELGVIRPLTSPWATPVVLVRKKDKGTCFCIDIGNLNSKTPLDGFPMPPIHANLKSIHGTSIFSTFYLKSGYWQVKMSPESIVKTAFMTKTGQYKFLHLPFGLKTAATTFQQLMTDKLFKVIGNFCLIYVDDIVVYCRDTRTIYSRYLRSWKEWG